MHMQKEKKKTINEIFIIFSEVFDTTLKKKKKKNYKEPENPSFSNFFFSLLLIDIWVLTI